MVSAAERGSSPGSLGGFDRCNSDRSSFHSRCCCARAPGRAHTPDLVLPGISITTSATDYELFERVQLARFDGKRWVVL